MINKDNLTLGDTIWQVDFNGSDVTLRKIQIDYLHQIAGKYWVSCEQEGSMDGIMLKADSPYLFHFESDASQYLKSMYTSIDVLLNKHMEVSE